MATPMVYASSQARGWNWAIVETYAADVATLDALTHCTRPGFEPTPPTRASAFGFLIHCSIAGTSKITYLLGKEIKMETLIESLVCMVGPHIGSQLYCM